MVLLSLISLSSGLPLESISYLRDTSEEMSIDRARTASYEKTFTDNLGVENGVYWFKIDNIPDERVILEMRTSHIKDLSLYDNSGKLVKRMDDARYPSFFLVKNNIELPLYLKADFPLEAHFPIHISTEEEFARNDKLSLLGIGFFYGTSIALIIATLIFFSIARNTQFLFFAVLIIAVLLSQLANDNLLYLFGGSPQNTMFIELIGHYSIGLAAFGFMMFYLKIRKYQLWIKWSMLVFTALSTLGLITYLTTKSVWTFILVDIAAIATITLMFILLLIIAKGTRRAILMVVYSFNILFLTNIFTLQIFGVAPITFAAKTIAGAALINFTLIAVLLLISFKNIQSRGILMKHKIKLYIEELKELSAYKNVQDADDKYMESLIYQFQLENIEVRILNDISKGMSNIMIAKKHNLTEDKLQSITNALYSKLGLESASDLEQLAF